MASQPTSTSISFALAGAGRVATAIGVLWARRGHRASGVWSRSPASAERASALLGAPVTELSRLGEGCDVVVIGTVDAAIGETGLALSRSAQVAPAHFHLAGSLGVEVLRPLLDAGSQVAAVHPVQACPSVEAGVRRLPGSAWGLTSTPGIRHVAQSLIRDIDGFPVDVAEEDRPQWHAAAVATSNGIAAVLAIGEAILASIGKDAAAVLGPLAQGTLSNASEGGGGGPTLTGPAVRGEGATVAAHLAALGREDQELVRAYADVTRAIVTAGRLTGRLDEATASRVLAAAGLL